MSTQTLVSTGDSLEAGFNGAFDIGEGGTGMAFERAAELLADITTLGPLISSGIRPVWNNIEWTYTGTWTTVDNTHAYDKSPYSQSKLGTGGTGTVATFTRSPRWRKPVGFALYWTDASGQVGDFQYSLDGGTWTNIGQTITNDNSLNKVYVNSPFTNTLQIRAYNGTSNVGALIVGVEMFWANPNTASGLIVHHLGHGGDFLHTLMASGSGDPLAFWDSIKLAANTPPSRPTLGTTMIHINDWTFFHDATMWDTDLRSFYTRVSPLGPVGFISPWEVSTAGTWAGQATNRAQSKTTAASVGAKLLDMYDTWAANGWTGNAAVTAAGLMFDDTHLSQLGHLRFANHLYWFIRNQILSYGDVLTVLPQSAHAVTPTYTGKAATVVFTAAAPVAVTAAAAI